MIIVRHILWEGASLIASLLVLAVCLGLQAAVTGLRRVSAFASNNRAQMRKPRPSRAGASNIARSCTSRDNSQCS